MTYDEEFAAFPELRTEADQLYTSDSCSREGCCITHGIVRGFCDTHYTYARSHGLGLLPVLLPTERLILGLERMANGCLEWIKSTSTSGYGTIGVSGKTTYTHRLAWEVANGRLVPDGMRVLHHCDNPPCCEPTHLFLGTAADNTADMLAKGRQRNGRPRVTRVTHATEGALA